MDASPETVFRYVDPDPSSPRSRWDKAIKELQLVERMDQVGAIFIVVNSCQTWFTLKHREPHGSVITTVATDALVLKHQAITIHNADLTFIVLDRFHIKILHIRWTASENEITFWKKMTQSFKG